MYSLFDFSARLNLFRLESLLYCVCEYFRISGGQENNVRLGYSYLLAPLQAEKEIY